MKKPLQLAVLSEIANFKITDFSSAIFQLLNPLLKHLGKLYLSIIRVHNAKVIHIVIVMIEFVGIN